MHKKDSAMRKPWRILAVVLALAYLVGVGGGAVFGSGRAEHEFTSKDRYRGLDGFSDIKNTTEADVTIALGRTWSIVGVGDPQDLQEFELDVRGDELVIRVPRSRLFRPQLHARFQITVPDLRAVQITGSGNAEVVDEVSVRQLVLVTTGSGNVRAFGSAENLAVTTTGSGNIEFIGTGAAVAAHLTGSGSVYLDVGCDAVEARITGSGDLTLVGSADAVDAALTASGDLNGGDFRVETGVFRITGSGDASMEVTEYLDAALTGSGNLTYDGRPRISIRSTGSGSLRTGL